MIEELPPVELPGHEPSVDAGRPTTRCASSPARRPASPKAAGTDETMRTGSRRSSTRSPADWHTRVTSPERNAVVADVARPRRRQPSAGRGCASRSAAGSAPTPALLAERLRHGRWPSTCRSRCSGWRRRRPATGSRPTLPPARSPTAPPPRSSSSTPSCSRPRSTGCSRPAALVVWVNSSGRTTPIHLTPTRSPQRPARGVGRRRQPRRDRYLVRAAPHRSLDRHEAPRPSMPGDAVADAVFADLVPRIEALAAAGAHPGPGHGARRRRRPPAPATSA